MILGFLLKAIGAGLAIKGIDKIKNNFLDESRRKNSICHFDDISKEEFYVIVKQSGKRIKRLTSLYAEETMVYGIVRSQSGISDWCFRIDFNDYGYLSGKYWVTTDNKDSDIPQLVANRISSSIVNYPDCVDGKFDDELYNVEYQETMKEEAGSCCPYCGKRNSNEDARFCMFCGMRFRV